MALTSYPGRNAIAPVWRGVEMIRDPYTSASKAQVRLTLIAFFSFKILRETGWQLWKARTAYNLRALPGEIRVSGRTVSGTVVAYGDVADMGVFREVFLPGAFGEADEIEAQLNVMHFEQRIVARTGGGLVFRDTPGSVVDECHTAHQRAS